MSGRGYCTCVISLGLEVRSHADARVEELGPPYTRSSYIAKLIEIDAAYKLVKNGVDEQALLALTDKGKQEAIVQAWDAFFERAAIKEQCIGQ